MKHIQNVTKLLTIMVIMTRLGKANCSKSKLYINEPDPFPKYTFVKIGEPDTIIEWNRKTLVSKDFPDELCGSKIVEFFEQQGGTIDPTFVQYDETKSQLTVLRQTDFERAGNSYTMYYTVKFIDYPWNSVQSQPFKVVIASTCKADSLTAPKVSGITLPYTITAPELFLNVDSFIVDPPECEIVITVEVTPELPEFSPVLKLTANELHVFQDNGTLVGVGSYSIKITAITSTLIESVAYGLNILDPCVDENFVNLIPPNLKQLIYTITDGSLASPIEYNVGTFTPTGQHQLCGELTPRKNKAIEESIPVDYDIETGVLRVYSDNQDLIGTDDEIRIGAKLGDYYFPNIKFPIEYHDPCLDSDLVKIISYMQLDSVYYYDDAVLVYELRPPAVLPSFCQVSYTCSLDQISSMNDLCNYSSGNLQSNFDVNTLTLTINGGTAKGIILVGDYTFIIKGTIVPQGAVTADSVFTLSIKDPCVELNQVTFDWAAQSDPDTYFYTDEEQQLILVKPIVTPSYCPITYSCAIDAASPRTDLCQIDQPQIFGDFDLNQLTYTYRFTNQFEVARSSYKFVISAELSRSPGQDIGQTSFVLTLGEPCHSPYARVIPTIQTNPDKYAYRDTELVYVLKPFETDPPGCPLTVSCQVSEGPRTDLCYIKELPELSSQFIPLTLELRFKAMTADVAPQGDYKFVIDAKISRGIATGASSFTLTVWNPCLSVDIKLNESALFPSLYISVFDAPVSFPYKPKQLVTLEALSEDYCGATEIQFKDFNSGKDLDPQIFDDGFADAGDENVNFSILPITDSAYFNLQMTIEYIVSLVDYPSRQVSNVFEVKINVLDWCDPRILELIDFMPSYCQQDDTDNENENESSKEDQVTDLVPEEAKNSTEQSSRPIYEPQWLSRIDNQVIVRGRSDLNYFMGEPLNYYGEKMNVTVDFGDLSNATYYDNQTNQIIIDQLRLPKNDTGYQHIDISSSYLEEATNETISFKKTIYLLIIEPEASEVEPTPWWPETLPTDPDLPVDPLLGIDKVTVGDAMLMENSGGSVPYIKHFSWDGKLRIGWSHTLRIDVEPEKFEMQKVAVQAEIYNQFQQGNQRGVRLLQSSQKDVQIEDFILSDGLQFKITDAIEISQIFNEEIEDELQQTDQNIITWKVLDYSTDELVLEVNQAAPESQGLFILTFWGTKYFVDDQDRQVPFGTQLKWKAYRQALPKDLEQNKLFQDVIEIFFFLIGVAVLIQIVTCGSILPFWMFFNALQLLTHLVLITADIPVAVNLLLTELLTLTRLQFDFVHYIVAIVFSEELEMMNLNNTTLDKELFVACGYSASLIHDMTPFLVLMAVGVATWVLLYAKDLLRLCIKKNRHEEAYGISALIRTIYECFFEIVLCLLINWQINAEGRLSILGLSLIVLVGVFLAFLCLLCFRYGPYVNGSYESWSLTMSCWAYRPLREKHINAFKQELETMNKKKALLQNVINEGRPQSSKEIYPISEASSQSEESSSQQSNKQASIPEDDPQLVNQICLEQKGDDSEVDKQIFPDIFGAPRLPFHTEEWSEAGTEEVNHEKRIRLGILERERSKNSNYHGGFRDEVLNDSDGDLQMHIDNETANSMQIMQQLGCTASRIHVDYSANEQAENSVEEGQVDFNDRSETSKEKINNEIEVIEMREGGEIEPEQPDGSAQPEDIVNQTTDEVQENTNKYHVTGLRLEKLKLEAKARMSLEQRSLTSKRFSTLYTGLKGNSEHNVAVMYPLVFLVRRIAYALSLILLYEHPYLATLSLMVSTMFVLSYVLVEHPWKSNLIHHQHVWNEIGFYLITLTLSFLTQSRLQTTSSDVYLSWAIIGILAALLLLNTVVILAETFARLHLILLRVFVSRFMKQHGSKIRKISRNKVAAHPDDLDEENQPTRRGLLGHKTNAIQISLDEPLTYETIMEAIEEEKYYAEFDNPNLSRLAQYQMSQQKIWQRQAQMKAMSISMPSEAEVQELLKGKTAQEKRLLLQEVQKKKQQKMHLEYLLEQEKIKADEQWATKNIEERQAIEKIYDDGQELPGVSDLPNPMGQSIMPRNNSLNSLKNSVTSRTKPRHETSLMAASNNLQSSAYDKGTTVIGMASTVGSIEENKLPELNPQNNIGAMFQDQSQTDDDVFSEKDGQNFMIDINEQPANESYCERIELEKSVSDRNSSKIVDANDLDDHDKNMFKQAPQIKDKQATIQDVLTGKAMGGVYLQDSSLASDSLEDSEAGTMTGFNLQNKLGKRSYSPYGMKMEYSGQQSEASNVNTIEEGRIIKEPAYDEGLAEDERAATGMEQNYRAKLPPMAPRRETPLRMVAEQVVLSKPHKTEARPMEKKAKTNFFARPASQMGDTIQTQALSLTTKKLQGKKQKDEVYDDEAEIVTKGSRLRKFEH